MTYMEDSGSPLISVMICTYNGERYLSQTIESVLNQTYSNLELIIVDDGSTDHTVEIIKNYQKNDERIRLFTESHKGFAASRNKALRESRGQWIAIIDHDDLCYPERLEMQLALTKAYPEADFCFCDTDFIDEDNNVIGSQFSNFDSGTPFLGEPFIEKVTAGKMLLQLGGFIDSESVFIRRGIAEKYGMVNTKYLYAADYDFFIRLGFEINFCFTRAKLSAWRLHKRQATKNNKAKLYLELIDVLLNYLPDNRVDMRTKCSIGIKIGKLLVRTLLRM
ncbi:MAG: glycosyltransferase [Syntrophaceae bacterium]